jgi:hypothetical protein
LPRLSESYGMSQTHEKEVFCPSNAERLIKTSRSEPFKNEIPHKNMREKLTNTPIIHSIY